VNCKATHRNAQLALSSDSMVKTYLQELGLPLWSHLTVAGNFNQKKMSKVKFYKQIRRWDHKWHQGLSYSR
jgi:ribosomal protein L21